MKRRRIKGETLEYGNKKISFLDFAKKCYSASKKECTFDFYLIKNNKLLKQEWNKMILTLKKEALEEMKEIRKEHKKD